MLYNINDSNFSKIIKQSVFWISLASMVALFIFLAKNEIKPAQKPITLKINVNNKVNICLPDDEKEINRKKIHDFENNR